MSLKSASRYPHTAPFADVCGLVETVLTGTFRREVVADLSDAASLGKALSRLRTIMRADVWRAGGVAIDLARAVRAFDRQTREEGFHALHDWDGVADHVNPDTIPVDVLQYLLDQRGHDDVDPVVLAVLVDYHFMHVLGLLTLHIWDDGDPDENLDRVNQLLQRLQGEDGSGQQFAADAEALLLIATSHFELHERGYETLLARVRTLGPSHRTAIALGHATSIGCHLRFGFQATYGRDTTRMRTDNLADYPWLCFALATLMDEYARLADSGDRGGVRQTLVEALLNGLSPDARAFVGDGPAALSAHEAERTRFRQRFREHQRELVEAFEALRPTESAYSPLSFFFNFAHNVLKGSVVDALLWGQPWRLGLSDLLTSLPRAELPARSRMDLARTLMAYARTNPHRIRGRLMPVIVYDPESGYRAFRLTLRRLAE